ncbi:LysR family transcriptional regulator [Yaniella flava]|uniref:LysR family transcriptional regulator n=1 Tax=Yaniella flava TaxID=287930 RepID=A0ABP5FQA6_9MICC|nr:LysR family transcriptional regulator [Micrococcaceae bacterium]
MVNTSGTQPTLRQLELFIAAAENGSFAAAADAVFVTPNAVSSAVTALESIFDTQLFIRRRAKGLTTTAAGQDLVIRASELLDHAKELPLHIGNVGSVPRGQVKVGCYSTLAATVVPELWAQTAHHLPAVQLDIEEGPVEILAEKLLNGHLDMMISYRVGLPTGILSEELFQTSPHVALPEEHPMAALPAVKLESLEQDPLILLDLPPAGDNTLRLLHERGLRPWVIHRSTSYETVRSMVARGFGYSLFFQQTMTDMSYEGLRLVHREIEPPLNAEPVVLSHHMDAKPTRRASAVAKLITNMTDTSKHKPNREH